MRLLSIWAFCVCLSTAAYAQNRCATQAPPANGRIASMVPYAPATPPSNPVATESTTGGSPVVPEEVVIPVVVHVVYRTAEENISDEQIRSQIESLNTDFNRENTDFKKVPAVFAPLADRAAIRFRLATADPEGRPTDGILRRRTERTNFYTNDAVKAASSGGSDVWDSRQYLNVWVCNMPSNLQGYASVPGEAPRKDGIVIRYDVFGTRGRVSAPFDKGRTLTHEVGHWLGLRHLWGDTPCGDDGVHDTPRQRSGNRGVPQFPRVNTGCDNGPYGDMFMNFMDFSDDAALLMFTRGQVSMMRSQFVNGGARHSLLSSKGLDKPWNASAVSAPVNGGVGVKVYPNPATHSIRVSNAQQSSESGIPYSITDAAGKPVLTGRQNRTGDPIDVSRLPEGVYHLQTGGRVTSFLKSR